MYFVELIVLLIGTLVGIIASIVGIGGGVFFVPVLYFIFHLEIHEAVGTSLFAILFLSASAFMNYSRMRKVNYKVAFLLEIPTAIGAYIASLLSVYLSSFQIRLLYSITLYFVSLNLLKKSRLVEKTDNLEQTNVTRKRLILGMIVSFFAGMIAGTTGSSGGILKTPIMIIFLGLPIKVAVGTSSLMIFFTSLAGVIGHNQVGQVNYNYGLYLGLGAIIGAQIGSRLAIKMRGRTIRVILAIVLMAVATRMIIG